MAIGALCAVVAVPIAIFLVRAMGIGSADRSLALMAGLMFVALGILVLGALQVSNMLSSLITGPTSFPSVGIVLMVGRYVDLVIAFTELFTAAAFFWSLLPQRWHKFYPRLGSKPR